MDDDPLLGKVDGQGEVAIGHEQALAGTNDRRVEAVLADDHVRAGVELFRDSGKSVAALHEIFGFAKEAVVGKKHRGIDFAEQFARGAAFGCLRVDAELVPEHLLRFE